MIQIGRLIVLGTTKTGDKSLVVHALSSLAGRRSFIVSAGKGSSLYLPLNILDAEIVENPKSDLWRLRNVSPAYPLNGLRSDMSKNSMSLFISEVLYRVVHDGVFEEGLYAWCEKSILTLDALPGDFANFHLRFLLEFAGAMGFCPSAEDLEPFAGEHFSSIRTLLQSDFASSMLLPLTGHDRSEISEILLKYLSHHTECQINVRSLKVLGELFANYKYPHSL